MKTKILVKVAMMLFLTGSFSSCSKKVNNESTSIIGEWKLERVEIMFVGESNDYSQYNIVYEFNENGILTVSGETDHIELYRGHETGEYPYSIISEVEAKEKVGIVDYRLKIGTIFSSFNVSSEGLIIDGRALDGATYYLLKN